MPMSMDLGPDDRPRSAGKLARHDIVEAGPGRRRAQQEQEQRRRHMETAHQHGSLPLPPRPTPGDVRAGLFPPRTARPPTANSGDRG